MPKRNAKRPDIFTVLCRWHPRADACDDWQSVVVVLGSNFGGADAADEACLYLIRDRQGEAQPWLVIEGAPKLTIPDDGCFDAQEYDETITFSRKIVSCRNLT